MNHLVITKDYEAGKRYINNRIFGSDLRSRRHSPLYEVVLERGDSWRLITIGLDNIVSAGCGMTMDAVHFLEDLTIKEMYGSLEYIAPVLYSAFPERGRVFIGGHEWEMK